MHSCWYERKSETLPTSNYFLQCNVTTYGSKLVIKTINKKGTPSYGRSFYQSRVTEIKEFISVQLASSFHLTRHRSAMKCWKLLSQAEFLLSAGLPLHPICWMQMVHTLCFSIIRLFIFFSDHFRCCSSSSFALICYSKVWIKETKHRCMTEFSCVPINHANVT